MSRKIKHTSLYGGEYELQVSFGKYANGQTRIQLIDSSDGIPYCTATVAVDYELAETEVAIKNYSENEGILNSLIDAGVIGHPRTFIQSGYVKIPICKLKLSPTTSA
jgi:hypothetical protein